MTFAVLWLLVYANIINIIELRERSGVIRIPGPAASHCQVQEDEEGMIENPFVGDVLRCELEIFLVIEGRISYCANGEWTEVGPGGVVYLPRETPHGFRNVGKTPSRHWIITTPSGFEVFFSRCADEFAKASPPDMGRIAEIFNEHGITLLEGERS